MEAGEATSTGRAPAAGEPRSLPPAVWGRGPFKAGRVISAAFAAPPPAARSAQAAPGGGTRLGLDAGQRRDSRGRGPARLALPVQPAAARRPHHAAAMAPEVLCPPAELEAPRQGEVAEGSRERELLRSGGPARGRPRGSPWPEGRLVPCRPSPAPSPPCEVAGRLWVCPGPPPQRGGPAPGGGPRGLAGEEGEG